MSTTRSGRPTATPSRAPAAATPGSRASTRCSRRSRTPTAAPVIAADPAAQGVDELRPRRGPAGRRRAGHRPRGRREPGCVVVRADSALLRPRRDRRRPPARRPLLGHRPAGPRRSAGRSPPSTSTRGRRSTTRTRSSTRTSSGWISDAEVAEVAYTAFTSTPQGRAGHRPADRAPGHAASTRPGAGPRRRAVHRLPLPRRVHRQPAADARRRGRPPRPRRSSSRSSPT